MTTAKKVVRVTGFEPAWATAATRDRAHWLPRPARLPISPHSQPEVVCRAGSGGEASSKELSPLPLFPGYRPNPWADDISSSFRSLRDCRLIESPTSICGHKTARIAQNRGQVICRQFAGYMNALRLQIREHLGRFHRSAISDQRLASKDDLGSGRPERRRCLLVSRLSLSIFKRVSMYIRNERRRGISWRVTHAWGRFENLFVQCQQLVDFGKLPVYFGSFRLELPTLFLTLLYERVHV